MPIVTIPLKALKERGLVREIRGRGRRPRLILPFSPHPLLLRLALSKRAQILIPCFLLLIGGGMALSWTALFPGQQAPALLVFLWLLVLLAGAGVYAVGRDVQFSLYLDAFKLRAVLEDPALQQQNWKGREKGVKSHYRLPGTHLRLLAGAKHGDLNRRSVGGWRDPSSFAKAKQTLRTLGMLDGNDEYAPWKFSVNGNLSENERWELECRLCVLWDVLLRHEYEEMIR